MDSKFKGFVISLLRRGTLRWKPTQEVLKEAKETYYIDSKNGKKLKRVKFKCASCNKFYCRKEICVDHREPVVGPEGFTNFHDYILRMFCPKENLQALCKGCHKSKTKGESDARKNKRQLNKKVDK